MGLPKLSVETKDVTNNSVSVKVYSDSMNVRGSMKVLFLIDSSTKFFHRKFSSSSFCKTSGEVINTFYNIYDRSIEDFFLSAVVNEDFFSNSGINQKEKYFFMKIPDPSIDGAVDWESVINELSVLEDIYYVVNLTNKDYLTSFNYMVNTLKKAPHKRDIMVIDKLPSFVPNYLVANEADETSLYSEFDKTDKDFKTVYVPSVHNRFVNPEPSTINFWEVGETKDGTVDCTLNFPVNPPSNKKIVRFFIPPVKLKKGIFNITDPGLVVSDNLIDLQGVIPMFFIGREFYFHDKQTPINQEILECITSVNSSDEIFFKISDYLTESNYRLSVLSNSEGACRIKYARTMENIYAELEEVAAIETSDAINILIKNNLVALVKEFKTVNTDNLNVIQLSMVSFVNDLKDEKYNFVADISLSNVQIDEEFPDVIEGGTRIKLYSTTKDVSVVLEYSY